MSGERQDKKYKESEEFVDNFIEFISGCNELSNDDLARSLQDDGVDVPGLIKSVQSLVDGALERERLSWQEQAISSRKENAKKFLDKKNSFFGLSKDQLVDRVRSICMEGDHDFSFAHRNLKPEDLSEDELREILSEYEQLGDEE